MNISHKPYTPSYRATRKKVDITADVGDGEGVRVDGTSVLAASKRSKTKAWFCFFRVLVFLGTGNSRFVRSVLVRDFLAVEIASSV